ncbi:MAG TPA: phosphate-starvation-inducible PsiE family protein [Myxococcales bacterium]
MPGTGPVVEKGLRGLVARAFGLTEDAVYIGMGVLLAFSAVALLISGGLSLWNATIRGAPLEAVIGLLDRTLLVLMLVELLYTVRVSFRQHALLPEPFLIVGLIAATRRILVVTAEFSVKGEANPEKFKEGMLEIALLTFMVVALVASLLMLRSKEKSKNELAIAG